MRVLVTTASRHGATAEIARTVSSVIAERGFDVETLPPDEISAVDGFDAVVLGSAVYMGRWLEPARAFAKRFETDLKDRPVWLFSSGPIGNPPKPDADSPDAVAAATTVAATEHRRFAGAICKDRLSLAERAVVRAVKAGDGDYRDWEAIRAWAGGIAKHLASTGVRR